MPSPQLGGIGPGASYEDLLNYVIRLERKLDYVLQTLDSDNIFEAGGWRVTPDQLASKDLDVGMSTEDTGGDDIRFWAGDVKDGAPKFKVTKSGLLTAVDGDFSGKITADEGTIGGFTITATTLTADAGGTIQNKTAAANKVYLNDTGLHANDSSGVERLTIGTTPALGAKALIGRDSSGNVQSIYTYDTESTADGTFTGQFITAHGAVILISDDGDVRVLNSLGGGFRAVSGFPEARSTSLDAWSELAKKSYVDTKATAGASTSSVSNHNHGIPDGTVLMVDGGGTVTFVASGGHSHTQT